MVWFVWVGWFVWFDWFDWFDWFGMMSDEFSSSYGPMALLEVYAGARMTPTSRFHRSKTFMYVVHALHQAFTRYEHDVSSRTDRWNAPEPWHRMLQLIYDDFFLSMGLPAMTRMPTLTGAHDYMRMSSGPLSPDHSLA